MDFRGKHEIERAELRATQQKAKAAWVAQQRNEVADMAERHAEERADMRRPTPTKRGNSHCNRQMNGSRCQA